MKRGYLSSIQWRTAGHRAVDVTLRISSIVLSSTGRILIASGLLLQTLRARIGPP